MSLDLRLTVLMVMKSDILFSTCITLPKFKISFGEIYWRSQFFRKVCLDSHVSSDYSINNFAVTCWLIDWLTDWLLGCLADDQLISILNGLETWVLLFALKFLRANFTFGLPVQTAKHDTSYDFSGTFRVLYSDSSNLISLLAFTSHFAAVKRCLTSHTIHLEA
jgi:hypothetical protein